MCEALQNYLSPSPVYLSQCQRLEGVLLLEVCVCENMEEVKRRMEGVRVRERGLL